MDIAAWLKELGLDRYAEAFRENAIDEDVLPELTADDLREIGVGAVGHRRKLLRAIGELRGDAAEGGGGEAPAGTSVSGGEPGPARECLAAAEGERRQVTVLFCDLSDYTGLSRELGAEEIHALLGHFFDRVDRIVENHGGRVDKHIGDCAMAVFGAPVAHGNDAERAARAALSTHRAMAELSSELGRSLRVHTGVASGQVVASGTGSASHREYTVTGDTVNLASRLAEAAEPDEILVSELVHRALSDRIVAAPRGRLSVKGLAEAVPAWRLQEIRAPEAAPRRFFGRRGELNQFRAALADCRESGVGQTIYVRGEAGIGKSSLVEQLQTAAREAGFACHAGAVFDFGAGIGLDAVRVLVRDLLEVGTRRREDAQAVIDRALHASLVNPDDAVFLHDLLDVPPPQNLRARYDAMDNATRYRGKCRCVTRLVARAARMQPRLLVVEDVHWADSLVLGYLAELSAAVGDCPALFVMTTRLEGDPLDRAWRAQASGAPLMTLDLGPLRPDEARALAAESLEANGATAERCMQRAGGNPLFLQQLLLHAEESAESGVPGTIQSLVQARLDRLEPEDKAAVQAASALGQRFAPDALAHLLGSSYRPERLASQLLVHPQGDAWAFAHALIRDAVYDTLLSRRRRELHERAAEWFAESDPVLHAEHLERAEHPAAARAYAEAARSQMTQLRYQIARRLVERGLSLAGERADRFALSCLRGDILHDLGEIALAREAYDAAHAEASDEPERCQALIGLAAVKRISEELDDALADLERAEEAAVAHDLTAQRARIHFLRGNLCFPRGEIDGCLREHGRGLELARRAGDVELEAAALGGLGDAEFARGRMRSACRRLQECVNLCRRQGFGRTEVANHAQIAHAKLYSSTLADALSEARSATDAAAAAGHHRAEVNARGAACFALTMRADWPALREEAESIRVLIDRLGARRFDPLRLLSLGMAAFNEGDREDAILHLEQALNLAHESGIRFLGPTILGGFALVAGEPERSIRALGEAEAVIRAGCMGANHLRFYPNAMQVALNLGNLGEVERFAQALEDFTAAEPLPWSDFFVARGRALAACARGGSATALRDELERLLKEGRRMELEIALPDLKRALETVEAW